MCFNSSLYKLNCIYSLLEMWGWHRRLDVLIGQMMVIIVTPVLWAQAEPSNSAGVTTHTVWLRVRLPGGRHLLCFSSSWEKDARWGYNDSTVSTKEGWWLAKYQRAALQGWVGKPGEPVRGLSLCELEHAVQYRRKVFTLFGSDHVLCLLMLKEATLGFLGFSLSFSVFSGFLVQRELFSPSENCAPELPETPRL